MDELQFIIHAPFRTSKLNVCKFCSHLSISISQILLSKLFWYIHMKNALNKCKNKGENGSTKTGALVKQPFELTLLGPCHSWENKCKFRTQSSFDKKGARSRALKGLRYPRVEGVELGYLKFLWNLNISLSQIQTYAYTQMFQRYKRVVHTTFQS